MDMLDNILPWVIVPALGIALFAQLVMQTVYSRSSRVPAKMSGYAVARQVLDGSGLYDVEIEQVPGPLSNHFDVRRGVLQLSPDVYHGRHLLAAGIAAHEAGHAIQAARGFRLLAVREVAVPAAVFGSGAGILVGGGRVNRAIPSVLGVWDPAIRWRASCAVSESAGGIACQSMRASHAGAAAYHPGRGSGARVDGVACGGVDLRGRDSAIGADVDPVRGRWVRAAS